LFHGRTYTLTDPSGDSSGYFHLIRDLADSCLKVIPGKNNLRDRVRAASSWRAVFFGNAVNGSPMTRVIRILEEGLSPFLTGLDEHLNHLSLSDRLDRTLRMRKVQYLLSMLEIELTNRINAQQFRMVSWKMALIAHCLRDFRDDCRSVPGEVEERCSGCSEGCLLRLGSEMAQRYGLIPCISVSMDHKRLFKGLKREHPDMGVLGIACVPELVAGLRLCEKIEIPAVGVPLDANRCSRWFAQCLETNFNLEEMERILNAAPRS
jgi:hypothetical protein